MSNWLKELEAELNSRKTRGRARQAIDLPKINLPKIQTNNLTLPLFLVFCLFLVAGVVAYLYKDGDLKSVQDYIPSLQSQSQSEPREAVTLEKVWQRTQWNTNAITLMGALNNHNLYVSQADLPRENYIYLNEDWTINRVPDHIRLDDQSRAFLEKYVRKN